MIKLEKKDRKLIYSLYNYSKDSNTKIAKIVGVSKETIKNKIQKLMKEKVITNFTANVSLVYLDVHSFTVLLKFNEDINKNEDIINYFKNHPFSIWVSTLSGNYDIIVEFLIKDILQIEKTLVEIRNHFEGKLNKYEVDLFARQLRFNHLIKDLYKDLGFKPNVKKTVTIIRKPLDSLDRKILYELALNSNRSLIDLAESVGSTWDVVRYRIKQMENIGVLGEYFPELNYKKIGYMQFMCKISFQNIAKEEFESFEDMIKTNANITYAFTSATSFSVIFNCAYESIDALDNFLRQIQEKFKGSILDSAYYIQREQIKFTLFPKGLLD